MILGFESDLATDEAREYPDKADASPVAKIVNS
jgi:hypothetical protein